jgi:hypothetical protein
MSGQDTTPQDALQTRARWLAEQQVQQPRGAPPVSVGPTLGDAFGAMGGAALAALGLLDIPKNLVQTALGGGDQERFRQMIEGTGRESAQWWRERGTGFGVLPPDVQQTLFRLGVDILTDPLTYVGLGLAGRAARTVPPSLPLLRNLLLTLDKTDRGISAALAAPFFGARVPLPGDRQVMVPGLAQAVPAVLRRVPVGLDKQVMETGTQVTNQGIALPTATFRAAENLWETIAARAPESELKRRARDLADALAYLKRRGAVLTEDAADLEAARLGQLLPDAVSSAENARRLEGALVDLWQAVKEAPNARAGAAGLELLAETERRSLRAWEELLAEYRPRIDALPENKTRAVLWKEFYDRGYQETIRLYEAARTTFRRLARELAGETDTPEARRMFEETYDVLLAARTGPLEYVGLFRDPSVFPNPRAAPPLDERFQIAQTLLRNLEDTLGQAREFLPRVARDELGNRLDLRLREQDLLRQGLPGILAAVPEELKGTLGLFAEPLFGTARGVQAARQALEEGLEALWTRFGPQGVPYPAFDPARVADTPANWLGHINRTLDVLGLPPVQNSVELLRAFQGRIPDKLYTRIDRAIQKYPGGDLLLSDPYEIVLDRVIREHAPQLNITRPGTLERVLEDATALYKEQALATLTYPITNLASGLLMGALEGVNPLRVVRHLRETWLDAMRGTFRQPEHIEDFLAAVELPSVPQAVTGGAAGIQTELTAVREYTQRGLTASARIGATKLGVGGTALGGLAGALSTDADAPAEERAANIALGAAQGAAVGASLPTVSKFLLQRLGLGLENALRGEAWYTRTSEAVRARLPQLEAAVSDALATYTRRTYDPSKLGAARVGAFQPAPVETKSVLDAIRQSEGLIGPSQVQALLREAGLDSATALRVSEQWRQALRAASDEGVELANTIHFDYTNLSNFEQFARTWLPFSTWAFKAFPFFLRHLVQRPVLLTTLLAIQEESERQVQAGGLTDRFRGALAFSPLDYVWSAILGRWNEDGSPGVRVYMNPLRGLLPFSDTARNLLDRPNETPVETALRIPQAFGLPGPHPLIDAGLRTTGLLGDAPPRGYIRAGGPLAGLGALAGVNEGRGIDLNAPLQRLEAGIRTAATGQQPADLDLIRTLKRIDELAVEAGTTTTAGGGRAAPFILAKATRAGPIWEEARRQVAQEQGLRSLSGFASQFVTPQAVASSTELEILGARAAVPVERRTLRLVAEAARRAPDAVLPAPVVEEVRQASLELSKARWLEGSLPEGQQPPEVEALLSDPTARNVQQVLTWMGLEQGNQNPLTRAYGQAGGTDKQQLQALLSLYRSLPAQILGDPRYQGIDLAGLERLGAFQQAFERTDPLIQQYIRSRPTVYARTLRYLQEQQERLRQLYPILDAYLAYEALHAPPRPPAVLRQAEDPRYQNLGHLERFLEDYWYPRQAVMGRLGR